MNKEIILKSKERTEYLKNKKHRKILVLFTQIFILVAFLAIWEILANKGIIESNKKKASCPGRIRISGFFII